MSVKNKIVGLAVTAMSLCGIQGAHAQKAQNASKAKAQTVNVVNQSKEYWLNSTDGDRMLVTKNKQGGVDIQTTDGLGWSVSRTGKVSGLGGLEPRSEDDAFANSVAAAVTNNSINKNKGYLQRDGESAIRSSEDGLKFFVNEEKVNGESKKVVWFIGKAGHSDLYAPRGNEISWEEAQKQASLDTENEALAHKFVKEREKLEATDFTKLTTNEMAFIENQSEEYESSTIQPQNLQAFNDRSGR